MTNFSLTALADQFLVLRTPKGIEFKGESSLTANAVEDVLVASLGYSVPTNYDESYFDGLVINDPFNVANGFVAVTVEGVGNLNLDGAKAFNVVNDGDGIAAAAHNIELRDEPVVYLDLKTDVSDRLTTQSGTIVPAENRSVSFLKPKQNKPDQDFLDQLAVLDGVTTLISDPNNQVPAAIVVRVSLTAFAKIHAADSTAYAEGLKLLKDSINELTDAADKAYKGTALIVALNTAEAHARAKRQAASSPSASPITKAKEHNIVAGRDPNFAVFFNIFFWFLFAFFFTLLAVSLAIGTMDPGRDSIIYRMTSTRMKKDN